MKTLTLKDKTEVVCTESSSLQELVVEVSSESFYETLKGQITADNLDGATLEDETLSGYIVAGSFMATGDDDYKTAHFALAKRNETESRLADLEDMIADVVGGAE